MQNYCSICHSPIEQGHICKKCKLKALQGLKQEFYHNKITLEQAKANKQFFVIKHRPV